MSRRAVVEGQLALDFGGPAHELPRSRPAAEPLRARDPLSAARIAQLLNRPEPTAEQVAVIEAPLRPLLVVAGAGSGKTETMAARVVWLVVNGMVEPDQVLGLTFTRKAAGELSERVRARLRALARRGVLADPRPVEVATYHSYAAALLRDHGLRIGVEPGARLLGEAAAWQLADDLVRGWDGEMDGVEVGPGTVAAAVLDLAGECAEHLLDPNVVEHELDAVVEAIEALPGELGDPGPGKVRSEVSKHLRRVAARRRLIPIVQAYARRKRELEALDFGDQVALAARIAREVPEVGAAERIRHRVLLLDEYQDTSHAQLVLLRELFGGGHPVTAVGDPHQSIYGWRGASSGNLQRFPEHFPAGASGSEGPDTAPAAVAYLSTSWRNDRAVLDVANRFAAPLRHPPTWAEHAAAVDVPALEPRAEAGPGAVRLEWHPTVEDESRSVAELAVRVREQDRERGEHRSMAVLCRKRSQFPLLEAALRARGVPVEVVGLGGLLHVPEIADLRAALEVMQDPGRGDALMRLLAGAAWRIGPRDLDALGAWSAELARNLGRARRGDGPRRDGQRAQADVVDERSLVEALDELPPEDWAGPAGQELSPAGRLRLTRLADLLRGLRARTGLALPDLVLEVEQALMLDVEVAARPGADPATARVHLDAFLDVAAGFDAATEHATLGAFLAWLGAAEVTERGLEPGAVQAREDAVQLLTVHASKGLEWDVVAVPGLVEGGFPTAGAKRRGGSGVPNSDGERPPDTSTGWLGDHGAVPYVLRGDADDLPRWRIEAAGTQRGLVDRLKDFLLACGERETAEERRLAYVAVTRARRTLLLTGAAWSDGKQPRMPSRFLQEASEVAEIGAWAELPEDDATNPREALRQSADWPLDPLVARRTQVEEGAALVRLAVAALPLAADPADPADPDRVVDVAAAEREAVVDVAAVERGDVVDVAAAERGEPEVTAESFRNLLDPVAAGWDREVGLLLAERAAGRTNGLVAVLPTHLSASRAVALAEDPDALAAGLRRPMPEPPSPHARRGSAFHAWLERRFGAAALVDVDELPGAADDDAGDADLASLQERFLGSGWAGRNPEAVEVAVETPVAGVVLRGRIDAVFRRDDGGWDVVDWKTGAPPRGPAARAREVQLAIYRLAWSRLHDVPLDRVTAAFFYAATGTTVRPVDLLTEADLERLLTLD